MEISDLSTFQLELLKQPLAPEAITQHPTKPYLSSIKAVYVTERMNDVFGTGVWQTKVEEITNAGNGMIVVRVVFKVPKYGIYYECFGGNDNGGENNKNFDLGDAYKGATTDAITKIGSYLGIGIDVFKGKTKHASQTTQTSNSSQNTDEPISWLNLKDKQGNKTTEYLALEKGILEGAKYTLVGIRKQYKVSKDCQQILQTELNII